MADVKEEMKDYFLHYASYVITERAIPHVADGLKPVQRRILEILWRQRDERLHKVANIVGQAMQLHPHGDAPIYEALVNLANKGYLLEKQGNFGNLHTGDPPAAARYIETKLSSLARATLFNPEITKTVPSYDGRNEEPITLPAKIPLLLMQGAEGIAVGMATQIFPHNFAELLRAEIAYLEEKAFRIYPDFLTGGIMDKSDYDKGKGKIKLRAKIEERDAKTLVIREICHGTTTESLIRSIDEAAKKGKIKIDSIHDYTSKDVEIEIKLLRGHSVEDVVQALYAFTQCEVTLHSQVVVIKEGMPWETDVHEVLSYNAELLVQMLREELQIERAKCLEKIFFKTLERIFIEERLYKHIEKKKSLEAIHEELILSLRPWHKKLSREPTLEDRERLLQIPIRRISQFDIDRNKKEIEELEKIHRDVEKKLKNVRKVAIEYLRSLLETFGAQHPRKTRMGAIEEVDRKAMETREIEVGFDLATGFVGTKVTGGTRFPATNFDKILVLSKEGSYRVFPIGEKEYVEELLFACVQDKERVFSLLYREKESGKIWAKRFVVSSFIQGKSYRLYSEGMQLLFFSAEKDPTVELYLPSLKKKESIVHFADIPLQSAQTRGTLICKDKGKLKVSAKRGKK
ncbi:MAG: DNA topoisomerase IV subunit A [Verrucomicrobiota bacterium]|nr:DNA topoisomerase IV subunit A [Verrucomicrobiota bacterium]